MGLGDRGWGMGDGVMRQLPHFPISPLPHFPDHPQDGDGELN